MTDTDQLKPCPFCGNEARLVTFYHCLLGERHAVLCTAFDTEQACRLRSLPRDAYGNRLGFSSPSDAIERWNHRKANG